MLVVGDQEVAVKTVAVRAHFEGDMGAMPVDDFAAKLKEIVDNKVRHDV